ncbi:MULTISPECIES: nitroreductase family deazaflavin-dependent oxidoreductase [unclassified Crossiella]|uniref:nitroreductase family deazaflavin-dependent oxidoreductase n=1 Tax=unclassified Crossiella TaxID=2620835 RepID=UPI001FFF4928|nr:MULTISPECIES: nitroreductase family deazaflavin-dependent oxidoreductase [unclassified Crossiella]MCK2242074.1 nitroreductase family deazaflavin-dependent oxidoreductase [Crossiella sp. S99.2]MCK2255977.1 nitroreductase family deazaflavin-dependent oxidoreductase [Crossiella sp. S99.1]
MNLVRNLAVKFGRQEWFAKLGRKLVPLDVKIQQRTKGKISVSELLGLPALLLTTTGRKSGQPRSVPLLFVPYGEQFIVTGSNWGQQHHPAWSVNLLATPEAQVTLRAKNFPVTGRLVTGEERAKVWSEIVKVWPAYNTYAERAGNREIRVFLLTKN